MANDLVTVENNPNPPINLQIINYHNVVDISNTNSSVDIFSDMNIRVTTLENTKEPLRTSGQNYVNDAQLAQLDKTSGTNTGDETQASIKSKLGISTLSGSNTGDETAATIKSKLGITTLSGANTGDETQATIISKLGTTPADYNLSNLTPTGKTLIPHLAMPSDSHIDLSLGASPSTYTAPADGYYSLIKGINGGEYLALTNMNAVLASVGVPSAYGNGIAVVPARKGDVVLAAYSASSPLIHFRFIYAEGSKL